MRRLITVCLVSASLGLAGCVPPKPPVERIVIQEVKVPVPVPCNPEIDDEPVYSDNDEALERAPNILEAMRLRAIGRIERRSRNEILNAALEGCKGPVIQAQ